MEGEGTTAEGGAGGQESYGARGRARSIGRMVLGSLSRLAMSIRAEGRYCYYCTGSSIMWIDDD